MITSSSATVATRRVLLALLFLTSSFLVACVPEYIKDEMVTWTVVNKCSFPVSVLVRHRTEIVEPGTFNVRVEAGGQESVQGDGGAGVVIEIWNADGPFLAPLVVADAPSGVQMSISGIQCSAAR